MYPYATVLIADWEIVNYPALLARSLRFRFHELARDLIGSTAPK